MLVNKWVTACGLFEDHLLVCNALRTSEQSLITKSEQHLLGSWKNTKDSRERLGANVSVIYITLPFSCAIINLCASTSWLLMKAEEAHTMPP